ncbi:hypothetical protein [Endozoicomonas sp. ALC020]|uniref:hypothetical protein n=1 Tax=unclassified Endozoicomonas TaxID=2644528 RepID=UPI003BB0BEB3
MKTSSNERLHKNAAGFNSRELKAIVTVKYRYPLSNYRYEHVKEAKSNSWYCEEHQCHIGTQIAEQ